MAQGLEDINRRLVIEAKFGSVAAEAMDKLTKKPSKSKG
jgi:hypothetical protein